MTDQQPFISVVIPSRNRPKLLRAAVESVMQQSFSNVEVVLVNDGSDEEHMPGFNEIVEDYKDRLKVVSLRRYPRGHGQSYAINSGVHAASGVFCTFLDDDDFWTDMQHLEKAHKALTANPQADTYYTNQVAVPAGQTTGKVIWLGDLEPICQSAGLQRENAVYPVDVNILMKSEGFAHLNCSVVRRELFLSIKGMDEDIRWECDRDFYLRTVEAAGQMLFNPDVVSQHHVPDTSKSTNMTTAISVYQRLNYQIYVLNKAAMLSRHPAIVKHARAHKTWALQKIAESMLAEGRVSDASYFCRQALFMTASVRWPLFCLQVMLRGLFSRS